MDRKSKVVLVVCVIVIVIAIGIITSYALIKEKILDKKSININNIEIVRIV